MPPVPTTDLDDFPPPTRLDGLVVVVLVLVALGGIVDLILDAPTSWWSVHVLLEVGLVILTTLLAVTLWLRWRDLAGELQQAQRSLAAREAERAAWQASAEDAMRGMREAVHAQMDRWTLTPTEREVALLLLQGIGHRGIAQRTGRSERTVRQHAVSIYDKSGLDGRAALAGYFLHGLSDVPVKGDR